MRIVSSLKAKLSRKPRPLTRSLYVRPRGVEALEFLLRDKPDRLATELLGSRLRWFWLADDRLEQLPARQPTWLTGHSAPSLVRVLGERLPSNEDRFYVLLCGGTFEEHHLTPDWLTAAWSNFCSHESPPVQLLVYDSGNDPYSYVFLPHERSPDVVELLATWERWQAGHPQVLHYRYLGADRLERMIPGWIAALPSNDSAQP